MNTQFLFQCIDSMTPEQLADPENAVKLLKDAAVERCGQVYPALNQYIDMLIAEYCDVWG